jgi:hypothetical protein
MSGIYKRQDVITGGGLPRNVWALSWVAFFNDRATEMSYRLLPQFPIGVPRAGGG